MKKRGTWSHKWLPMREKMGMNVEAEKKKKKNGKVGMRGCAWLVLERCIGGADLGMMS